MKKLIALTIALFVLAAGNVFGQSFTENITAQATVVNALTLAPGNNLLFGDVIAGTNGTIEIDGTNGTATVTNASNGQLGTFTFSGTVGAEYALSFTIPGNLTSTTTAATMPFVMNGVNFGRVEEANIGNGNFNPTTGVSIALGDDGAGDGVATVKLGGQVEPTGAQATETYEGTITIEVTPTSI